MPIILGMIQSKGGVGKTTTALNLAAEFSRRGKSVEVFDADPAGHAVLVAGDKAQPFAVTALLLEDADAAQVAAWAKSIRSAVVDIVIIDAPGSMGAAYGATIAISDLALVPSGATIMDVNGAVETVRIIRRHRKNTAKAKPDVLLVPSRIDRRTSAGKEAVATLAALTEPVGPMISYKATVADSLASGETVAPDSPSGQEFAALASAIETRLGL